MKIAFNPSTVAALITPPNNKDITFDLRGRNIFARGVKFCGTDTNTWRDIKINNVSIGSNTLDLRNGSNTTLTNTNGVVTINSTWRPVVDNLTSDSTTSSLSANLGKVLKSLIDDKSNSGHTHDDRYLKLTGGTMASNALITFADSGSWGTDKGPQGARGGLYWTGQSDYAKLYAEETVGDNLDLVIQFGDDNSNGLSIRNKANTQTSYISAGGVITTGTFKGNLDWSYITNKPSSYTPSAHTHAWNSLTHSSTTENQAILTNGKANGWKLYTLNISRWDNAANNAHSHANKSVLDGITSGLVNNWNTAFTFVNTITGTDTDKVINKWDEIVNFLAGITEDNKLNTLLNSKLSVYELANNTNIGAIKNNGIYYSTSDASSGTLTNSPFNTGFALINMTSYDGGDDLIRSRLAFNAYGEIKISNDRGQNNTTETWYQVLTSHNTYISNGSGIINGTTITLVSNADTTDGVHLEWSGQLTYDLYSGLAAWTNDGKKIKAVNKSLFATSGHTHDDRYLKLSGGWMSGDINFGSDNRIYWGRNTDSASISFKNDGDGDADSYMSFVTSDNGNEYFRWSHSSGSTNTEWMALRSDGLRVGGTKVSLEGHSHNNLYYTKTEVNNKLNGKSDTGHTHDDRYLKLTGGTMLGVLNFANNTWNKVGDDVYMGDHNIGGLLCIMGANSTTGLSFHKYGDASIRKSITFDGNTLYMNGSCDYATLSNLTNLLAINTVPNETTSTSVGSWSPISGRYVFHQKWNDTSTGNDSADFGIYLDGNLTANMVLDGYYNSLLGFRVIGATGGFLKANGTIDNSTYLTSHLSLSNYYTKGEVDNQLSKYKLKNSIWVPETKIICSNFRDFLNKENLHKLAQEELNLYRFFALGDESNYSSKYNYPVVDSHAMVFSINGNNGYIRSMNFDIRSNDIYVTSRVANGEWRSWVKLLNTLNTYVSNNKGYINGAEITLVNNADMLDGYHLSTLVNKSGENLIIGTTHASTIGWNQNGWSGGISTYDENNGVYKIWSTNGWHTLYYTLNSQYASKSISFSFDIMFISSESTEGPVGVYVSSSNIYIGGTNYCPSNSSLWEHKQGKITLGSTPYFGIMIRGTDNSGKSCFYLIKNLKVELGDLPTIWTPAHADITWNNLTGKPSSFIPSAHTHPYLPLSGGTITGVIKSVFESSTWINGVTNAIIKGEYTRYGAILSIPVKDGRISLSSFPANDNNIYFGYATTLQINTGTNAFNKEMYWDAPNNNLHADIFTGTLAGNAFTATKLQTARKIWGQSFDGSNNVDGTLTMLSTFTSSDIYPSNNYILLKVTNGSNTWEAARIGTYIAANNGNVGGYPAGLAFYTKPADGSDLSSAKLRMVIDANGNVGIGTTSPAYKLDIIGDIGVTGLIIRESSSLTWVNGRKGALLRETTSTGYHTLWSLKTTNGSWDFGEHNSSGWNNIPVLSYITDTNFNSGNNTPTYQIKFPLDSGTIALTKNIPTSLPANGGNADTVDGYHANGLLTALSNTNNGISVTVGGTTKSVSNISVNYASNSGNANTATTSSMLKTSDWTGGFYASSDTHYMCLGYMNCTGSYDSLTLLVTSAFWGNQHGSQDIITIQQSTNTNDTARIQTNVGRLRLGGSYERSFYYYKDDSRFRLYLYVYVIGGNSYGRWNISYLGGNATWVTAHLENVTKSSSWIGIGYSAQVNYANSADSATKVIVNLHTGNDVNYPLVWSNLSNTNSVTENQLYKSWSDLYYNPKNKRLTVGGSIYAAHFYESSDKTLKKNIKSILSSTNIPKIREFDWKDTGEHSYGFIALELEELGYGCLVNEADGKKTVNYTATLALTVAKLLNLINIQNKKISNLTKELKALKYGRKKNS